MINLHKPSTITIVLANSHWFCSVTTFHVDIDQISHFPWTKSINFFHIVSFLFDKLINNNDNNYKYISTYWCLWMLNKRADVTTTGAEYETQFHTTVLHYSPSPDRQPPVTSCADPWNVGVSNGWHQRQLYHFTDHMIASAALMGK